MPAKPRELSPALLRRVCNLQDFTFQSTAEVPELDEIIGQERATRATEFGIDVPYYGYNVFAMGPSATGKTSTIMQYLEQKAADRPVPSDWAYVNNFADPYRPQALRLPAGHGCELRDRLNGLLKHLEVSLPRAFEGEQYQEHRGRLVRELDAQRNAEAERLDAFVTQRGSALLRTAMGLVVAPVVGGQPLTPEQFQQLPPAQRQEIQARQPELQEEVERALRRIRDLEQAAQERLRNLDREIATATIARDFEALSQPYHEWPEIVDYLNAVQQDIVDQVDLFKARPQPESQDASDPPSLPSPVMNERRSPFDRYRVNIVVDNCKLTGAPVVLEINPTYSNLMGRIERRAEFGTLVTDLHMIKAGALHRANGGFIVVDARVILRQPLAWDALKRALRYGELRIEEPERQLGIVTVVGLEPEPIPLDVKVVLIGDPMTYYLLYAYDEEFQKLFKVRADFATEMPWTRENIEKVARLIRDRCEEEKLPHFDLSAVGKIVEYSARLVDDQHKLTTRFALILDTVREAAYWARHAGHTLVNAEDVQKAIDERIYRANQVEERLRERIVDGTIIVDTRGAAVGQVNGLSVLQLGDYMFGRPNRITAKTYLGQAGVINIEREAKLSGSIHDKGVLILAGYLGGKYAQDKPLSLTASIAFEQSYEGVEGDSASSTELYALLSSLSGLPLQQGIAVTGSVNQQGEVQAIGGVNEKIEGFFDVCRSAADGLTDEQGVVIPAANIKNLMLREDVVAAVAEERFHIYPVHTIDEGIAILTGVPAGERDADGQYPEGTVNALVDARLRELAQWLKEFGRQNGERKGAEADENGESAQKGEGEGG
ncbi:MAG: AAA family ATPase [Anaerolineae bacterium]|nr:AAA family ATPase [Anaerolineae bacterium]